MSDYHVTHNLDQLRPQLTGFGVHTASRSPAEKATRVEQLRRIIVDAGRELEDLLSGEG